MNFNQIFDSNNETIMNTYCNIRHILSYSYSINNFLKNLNFDGIKATFENDVFTFYVEDAIFTNLDILYLLSDRFWETKNLVSNCGYNIKRKGAYK